MMIVPLGLIVIAVIVMAVRTHARDGAHDFSLTPPSPGSLGTAARSAFTGASATSGLEAKLRTWVDAGLIDDDEASAITTFEESRVPERPSRVPMAAEAVGYIGGGLLVAAIFLLFGNRWESMATPARIAVLTAATALAALSGWWTGRNEEPALQRLGSVLWILAVAATAGLAAEIWIDAIHDGEAPDRGSALFIGSITLVAAIAAWTRRHEPLQHAAMFVAAIVTTIGVTEMTVAERRFGVTHVAVALLVLGGAWLASGLRGWLPPALLAELAGSGTALIAAQMMREDHDEIALWLGIGVAVVLLVLGVIRSDVLVLLVGTLGLFQWTPQIALFYLEDSLGAEATLGLIGALLIAVAGSITKVYPAVRARRGAMRGT